MKDTIRREIEALKGKCVYAEKNPIDLSKYLDKEPMSDDEEYAKKDYIMKSIHHLRQRIGPRVKSGNAKAETKENAKAETKEKTNKAHKDKNETKLGKLIDVIYEACKYCDKLDVVKKQVRQAFDDATPPDDDVERVFRVLDEIKRWRSDTNSRWYNTEELQNTVKRNINAHGNDADSLNNIIETIYTDHLLRECVDAVYNEYENIDNRRELRQVVKVRCNKEDALAIHRVIRNMKEKTDVEKVMDDNDISCGAKRLAIIIKYAKETKTEGMVDIIYQAYADHYESKSSAFTLDDVKTQVAELFHTNSTDGGDIARAFHVLDEIKRWRLSERWGLSKKSDNKWYSTEELRTAVKSKLSNATDNDDKNAHRLNSLIDMIYTRHLLPECVGTVYDEYANLDELKKLRNTVNMRCHREDAIATHSVIEGIQNERSIEKIVNEDDVSCCDAKRLAIIIMRAQKHYDDSFHAPPGYADDDGADDVADGGTDNRADDDNHGYAQHDALPGSTILDENLDETLDQILRDIPKKTTAKHIQQDDSPNIVKFTMDLMNVHRIE